jgi:DnaJ-class molecular chaperone
MRDPYVVLGVQRGANDADIKKAFRRAAKLHHPDQNRDDPKAAQRFSEINAAYEILGDAEKKRQFDRGEIDAEGKPKFRGFDGFPGGGANANAEDLFRHFRNMGGGRSQNAGFDPSDIFGRMFSETSDRARGARPKPQPQAGADAALTLTLTVEDIISGTPKPVRLPTGRDLEVAIPKLVKDGQTIRLRGQGYSSPTGGPAGDAMLTIKIAPHSVFTPEGSDLRMRHAVSLAAAVLGGPVDIPIPEGSVTMTLPAMTSGGRTLRLKGKGLPNAGGRGDLYVTIDVQLPSEDAELTALMRKRQS